MVFRVIGTTCASCEILLERELKKIPGVVSVKASHHSGEVTLTVQEGKVVTLADLERAVQGHKYRFEALERSGEQRTASWDGFQAFLWVILVGVIYLWLSRSGLLAYSPDIEGSTSLVAVFVIGLVAAFSSCTAIVSGLLVAVSAATTKESASTSDRLRPHVLFHIGRLVGFAGFGAIVGWLGSVLALSTQMNGVFVLAIAVLMIALGAHLLEILPPGVRVALVPKGLAHRVHDMASSRKPFAPAVLGAFTFFLPCGFTQSMQLYALSTGSPTQAALILFVFALGTTPALFSVGALTAFAKGKTLRAITSVAGVLVLVLGISNFQNGLTLLGWTGFTSAASNSSQPSVTIPADAKEQIITMQVTSAGTYEPDVLRVRAGVPVKWQVYGSDFMGCAKTLVMPKMNIKKNLSPGLNEIRFTPPTRGTYAFSCSMGMVRGTMIVE